MAGYVLSKWASEGASGILEIWPTMARRLHKVRKEVEESGNAQNLLSAFSRLVA
jgi:uncharacterized protein with GYD domain